jgi:ABC-type Mn2+/Zn2+ transport system permease subunit
LLAWSVALALAEGVTGLYVAYWLDLPPGPPVAVLGAAVYAVLALGTAARPLQRRPPDRRARHPRRAPAEDTP